MRQHRIHQLQAEQNQLIGILSRIPEDEVINRMSFESRLEQVEEELESIKTGFREPAKTILFFRGKPVVGTTGIFAKFGFEAVDQYNDLVMALTAQLSGSSLGDRGSIPNCKDNQLLITGTALGSFGFELEENLEQLECINEESPALIENSMKKALRIIKASTQSDDDLMDEIDDLDDRTISEIHDFLCTLAKHEAYCAVEVDDEYFSFDDYKQVERSARRFDKSNIIEEETQFYGEFIGALPESRSFEFKIFPSNNVIKGKIAPTIVDAMVINHNLEKQLKIKVYKKTVGKGNPRFTLLEFSTV